MDTLKMNQKQLRELKRDYAEAVKAKAEQFVFQGKDILTGYAKYLIEYLEARFNTPHDDGEVNINESVRVEDVGDACVSKVNEYVLNWLAANQLPASFLSRVARVDIDGMDNYHEYILNYGRANERFVCAEVLEVIIAGVELNVVHNILNERMTPEQYKAMFNLFILPKERAN